MLEKPSKDPNSFSLIVLGKIRQNLMFAPRPGELAPPPQGNRGSATRLSVCLSVCLSSSGSRYLVHSPKHQISGNVFLDLGSLSRSAAVCLCRCVGVSVRVFNAAAYNISVQITPSFRQNNSEAFFLKKSYNQFENNNIVNL